MRAVVITAAALALGARVLGAGPSVVAPAPRLVEVGGHRRDAIRAGSGSPAVVCEGGLGNPLDTWEHV